MLVAEYDYKTDIEVQREEAREEGREEGIIEGSRRNAKEFLLKSGLTEEVIAECCGLSLEEVQDLKARLVSDSSKS